MLLLLRKLYILFIISKYCKFKKSFLDILIFRSCNLFLYQSFLYKCKKMFSIYYLILSKYIINISKINVRQTETPIDRIAILQTV